MIETTCNHLCFERSFTACWKTSTFISFNPRNTKCTIWIVSPRIHFIVNSQCCRMIVPCGNIFPSNSGWCNHFRWDFSPMIQACTELIRSSQSPRIDLSFSFTKLNKWTIEWRMKNTMFWKVSWHLKIPVNATEWPKPQVTLTTESFGFNWTGVGVQLSPIPGSKSLPNAPYESVP